MTTMVLVICLCVVAAWDVVLTIALVAQRRRHDRLMFRVGGLAQSVTKVGRMRTGSQPAITSTQLGRPPPPFPIPPPNTNPMSTPPPRGRHASP